MNQLEIQWESDISDSDTENETIAPITRVQDSASAFMSQTNDKNIGRDKLFCLHIGSLKWTETEPPLISPWILIHLYEESTGKKLTAHGNEKTGTNNGNLFRTSNSPVYLGSMLFKWAESVIMPISYCQLYEQDCLILFEVLDTEVFWTWSDSGNVTSNIRDDVQEQKPLLMLHCSKDQRHRTFAWAFLKPRANYGTFKMEGDYHTFHLQLYRHIRKCNLARNVSSLGCLYPKESHRNVIDAFDQYKSSSRERINGYIEVSIRPSVNSSRFRLDSSIHESLNYHDIGPSLVMLNPFVEAMRSRAFVTDVSKMSRLLLQRDTSEKSLIVDIPYAWIPTSSLLGMSTHGAKILSFTDCGNFLAIAVSSKLPSFAMKTLQRVLVYRVVDGDRVLSIDTTHHDAISDLSWRQHDNDLIFLASSSFDGSLEINSIPLMTLSDTTLKDPKIDQEFNTISGANGTVSCLSLRRFFYADCVGKPCRIMFNGSPPIPSNSTLSTKITHALIVGSTNGYISIWDISPEFHKNLGYIISKESMKSYHQDEITSLYKPIHHGNNVTFYSGDATGSVVAWKCDMEDDIVGTTLEKAYTGKKFVPLFYIPKNVSTDLPSCAILQLTSISTSDDYSSKDNEITLLGIITKDIISNQIQGIVYDMTRHKVIQSLNLLCDETYEYMTCASFSPDGGRYVMGGSNLGRLYLWDRIQGCRIKSHRLDDLCVTQSIHNIEWNPKYHVLATSFECIDGPILLMRGELENYI